MSSFEIIPTHAFNFFVKYAIFESGNSFIMTIIFPWFKILSMSSHCQDFVSSFSRERRGIIIIYSCKERLKSGL